MIKNEKAAIAAGLWKPGQFIGDMREPANLWQALKNRPTWMISVLNRLDWRRDFDEQMFAALVALYDAEHSEQWRQPSESRRKH